jgi:hypothetical protein
MLGDQNVVVDTRSMKNVIVLRRKFVRRNAVLVREVGSERVVQVDTGDPSDVRGMRRK